MMFFSRERWRTIWLRRVTWRRRACVVSSAIHTSGKKPLAQSCASTAASILSVLILACAMSRTCLGLAITTRLTWGASTAATEAALPVASMTTMSLLDSCLANSFRASRRYDTTQPAQLTVFPGHRLGKSAVNIQSNDPHTSTLRSQSFERELAGNTTPTDPRSQRIRASRKGRPCNELGLAAQGLSAACPHLCAPDAPCPRWAHHNSLPRGSGGHQGAEIIMPDNGICERFHRTVLDEFYRIAFRKKIDRTLDALQADLDAWLVEYNYRRPHQGRWCFGKTPIQTCRVLDQIGTASRGLAGAGLPLICRRRPRTEERAHRQSKARSAISRSVALCGSSASAPVRSCACPSVSRKRTRLPSASTRAWIFMLQPPRLRPSA